VAWQRFPEVANKCISELIEDESIRYLDDRDTHRGDILTEPEYCSGAVLSSSICLTLLARSYYFKHVLPLVGALLSSNITSTKGRNSIGEIQLIQTDVPLHLQNKPYHELVKAFLRPSSGSEHPDLLPLGLFRRHDNASTYRYTFTNPSPDTVVHVEDRIFSIKRTKRWFQR